MAARARSARGELVDFDVIKIKQQLANNPIQIGTQERRRFIDEKDGVKPKVVSANSQPVAQNALKDISALSFAINATVVDSEVEQQKE
jgi:hypothetical protein